MRANALQENSMQFDFSSSGVENIDATDAKVADCEKSDFARNIWKLSDEFSESV